jgi:hypothetical protein
MNIPLILFKAPYLVDPHGSNGEITMFAESKSRFLLFKSPFFQGETVKPLIFPKCSGLEQFPFFLILVKSELP